MISRGVLQAVEALADRWELDPELAVLGLEPRGAESELQASVAGVINRDGLRGQNRGVPVGHTGDEQPETYPACRSGQCGECGTQGIVSVRSKVVGAAARADQWEVASRCGPVPTVEAR
jgi:hypothetical protein